ncbi:MAG TPA: hypothetical protein VF553_11165 [Pyrinomonadaceae bacterium]|jgi:hypothetical protein
MEKIDRLGWAAGFSLISFGRRIGVRSNDPALLDRLHSRLPPGWKPSSSHAVERLYSIFTGGPGARPNVRRFNLLYGDITRLARSTDMDEVLSSFESDLRLFVAEAAQRRLFIHAGVVGWRGKAILIPGRSMSGKTSLVVELIRAGATYYSDEFAVLDQRGRVHPYPKTLSIRDQGFFRQTEYAVESLGGRRGARPLPVGLVLVCNYKAGARWRPRPVSTGQGVLELLAHTISARRQPEKALSILQRALVNASILKGARGEAHELAASLLKLSQEQSRN